MRTHLGFLSKAHLTTSDVNEATTRVAGAEVKIPEAKDRAKAKTHEVTGMNDMLMNDMWNGVWMECEWSVYQAKTELQGANPCWS